MSYYYFALYTIHCTTQMNTYKKLFTAYKNMQKILAFPLKHICQDVKITFTTHFDMNHRNTHYYLTEQDSIKLNFIEHRIFSKCLYFDKTLPNFKLRKLTI